MKLRSLFSLAWENYKLILSIMTLTSHISKYTCHGDPLLEYSWVKEKYIFHWCPSWSRDDQATIKSYKFQSFFFQVQTTALWCYFYQDLNKLQDFSSFIETSDSTWLPSSFICREPPASQPHGPIRQADTCIPQDHHKHWINTALLIGHAAHYIWSHDLLYKFITNITWLVRVLSFINH